MKGIRHGLGKMKYNNGDTYDGEWRNDQEHGSGTYTHSNGSKHAGEFKNGEECGQMKFYDTNPRHRIIIIYFTNMSTGEYIDFTTRRKHHWKEWIEQAPLEGMEKSTYEATYEGEWKNHKRNGLGKLECQSRDDVREVNHTYNGSWKDDTYNGFGTVISRAIKKYSNREIGTDSVEIGKYVGNFENGQFHGLGEYRHEFPLVHYIDFGDWKHGRLNGFGEMSQVTDKSSLKYVGDLKKRGVRDGLGEITYSNELAGVNSGEWGAPTADPKVSYLIDGKDSDGKNSYSGEWRKHYRHGIGIATYSNGTKYVGNWKNGFKDGSGEITYSNGKTHIGEWKNGKLISDKKSEDDHCSIT